MTIRIAICAENEVVEGEVRGASLPDGTRIALYKIGTTLYATNDTCTHEAASLSEDGMMVGDKVECGWHLCSFDIATGAACNSPCNEPLKTYPVTIVDGVVHVEQ